MLRKIRCLFPSGGRDNPGIWCVYPRSDFQVQLARMMTGRYTRDYHYTPRSYSQPVKTAEPINFTLYCTVLVLFRVD